MRSRLKHCRVVGLVVAASALTALMPVATAQAGTDARSPDARDAAAAAQTNTGQASPDALDAALAARTPTLRVDLRSPDARDAALGVSAVASVPQAAPAAAPSTITVTERSSQTLAIVFSACALLLALLAVGFVGISRRPRPRWNAP